MKKHLISYGLGFLTATALSLPFGQKLQNAWDRAQAETYAVFMKAKGFDRFGIDQNGNVFYASKPENRRQMYCTVEDNKSAYGYFFWCYNNHLDENDRFTGERRSDDHGPSGFIGNHQFKVLKKVAEIRTPRS